MVVVLDAKALPSFDTVDVMVMMGYLSQRERERRPPREKEDCTRSGWRQVQRWLNHFLASF